MRHAARRPLAWLIFDVGQRNMIFLVLVATACLASFVPLAVATATKAKKVGSLLAGVFAVGFAATAGYFFSASFAVSGVSIALPVVLFGGVVVLSAIWTIFLFVTSDENN